MEHLPDPLSEPNPEEQLSSPENSNTIPPKFETPKRQTNIWLRSFLSLTLYLILGFYIFPSYKILLLITAIVMIHELGHFFAMKFFRYNDLGIFFIPLLGAYVSGSKREVSQKQSAIILLAGPLPGIVFGVVLYLFWQTNPELSFIGISFYTISMAFIILNLINLIPVYPLDGGQLLNRVFLDEESIISKGFVFLSILFLIWIALFGLNKPFYPLLIFPGMMLLRLFGEKKINTIEKRIEAEGINTDLDYKHLPDEDYWKIRNIIIEEHPSFKDVEPAPPYEFSHKEDKIMATIQSLLHRHLIQDVSVAGKILILLIWIATIISPWLLQMNMSFLNRFGF